MKDFKPFRKFTLGINFDNIYHGVRMDEASNMPVDIGRGLRILI